MHLIVGFFIGIRYGMHSLAGVILFGRYRTIENEPLRVFM